ncbi:MAG: aminotransferase class V-fold PLP-dependent enzyme [Chlamydiota bacterium]
MKDFLAERKRLFSYLGAKEDSSSFFFSSRSFLFLSLYEGLRYLGRERIFLLDTEKNPFFSYLEEIFFFRFERVPVDSMGRVDTKYVQENLDSSSFLFLQWADPLLGTIQPMEEIAKISEEKGIFLHVDVSTILGKIPFRFSDLSIDFLSFSVDVKAGDSLSTLIWKKNTPYFPFLQDMKRDQVLLELLSSLERIFSFQDQMHFEIPHQRKYFEKEIHKQLPWVEFIGKPSLQLPDTLLMKLPGIFRENIRYCIQEKNRSFSFLQEDKDLSSVLMACGMDVFSANSTIRWSLPPEIPIEELEKGISLFVEEVKRLKVLSEGIVSSL